MASTYVNNLRLDEMATGDGSGTWGVTTNTNLTLIGEAFGYATKAIADASTATLTIPDGTETNSEPRAMYLKLTGGGQACTVTLAPNTASKVWIIENVTSYTLTFTQGSGANVAILAGQVKIIATDGAGSGAVVYDMLQDLAVPDLFVDDDLKLQSDSAVLGFGADNDTTLTHTDGTGLTLNSTNKLCFNDVSQFIQGSSATVLSLGATDEIDLTATAVDLNGTLDISGTTTAVAITASGVITGLTVEATGDTAAGDNAAIGYTSAEGLILTGQGSTNDVTIKNDADADVITIATGATNVDIVGDVTASTVNADGDTAASDNAAMGYTSAEGLILTGQGSTNDVTIKNDADADVITIATGATNVDIVGDVTASTVNADGDTAASDNAAMGYTSAEGLILTGQGSTNDVTIKNDADADVITIPTGATGVTFAGAVSFPDGSAGSPSITNTGDTNTGLLFSAADTLSFTAGGTAQFTMADGLIAPVTNNDVDLGTDALEFKNAWFDGTVETDNLTIGGAQGSDGQVLTSTGSGVGWEDASGGGITGLTGLVENDSIWLGNDPSGTTSTASYNVALGTTALDAITTADNTVAIGYGAATAINTGTDNTAVGYNALAAATANSWNTCVGYNAGAALTGSGDTGSNNTIFGNGSGAAAVTSQRCTWIGRGVMTTTESPSYQVFIGMYAGSANYGNYSVAIGSGCLGTGAGAENVAIGRDHSSGGGGNNVTGSVYLGNSITATADNRVNIGNSTSYIYADFNSAATWTHSSDERMKKDIQTDTLGLAFINDLRPVTYKYKAPSEYPKEWLSYSPPTYTDKDGEIVTQKTEPMSPLTSHGLIAQEVKVALDKAGVSTFAGWGELDDGKQTISREMFVIPLINAIQELSAKVAKLENKE